MMSPTDFAEKRSQLKKLVTDFVAKEKNRLTLEREFLLSVQKSLGGTTAAYEDAAFKKALSDVSKYLK